MPSNILTALLPSKVPVLLSEGACQCAVVLLWLAIPLTLMPSSLIVFYLAWQFVWMRYFVLLYYTWVFFFDHDAPYNAGWKESWFDRTFRKWNVWDGYRKYFEAELIKEEELEPTKNYILAYHPHGVYCLSVFTNLFLAGSKGSPFPGLRTRVSTLPVNFNIPIWREFLLATGATTCAKRSLVNVLRRPGTCLVIAVGGAEEFHYMNEGTMDLVIEKRKGFAKLALETGASLVPVIGFGENELYSRLEHPILHKLNNFTQQVGRFAAPMFIGRFSTWMPKRSKLVTLGMVYFFCKGRPVV